MDPQNNTPNPVNPALEPEPTPAQPQSPAMWPEEAPAQAAPATTQNTYDTNPYSAAPSFVDSASPQLPSEKKKSGAVKAVLIVLLVLLAVAGIGYSVYAWTQNNALQSDVSNRDAQIKTLSTEVSSLKAASTEEGTAGNVIQIREMGLSIAVPDSIKDLTYSYAKSKSGPELVSFSTKAITDKYSSTSACVAFSASPPLGALAKVNGKYDAAKATSPLLKQFDTFYVMYAVPPTNCDPTLSVATEREALKTALSTIKEL